jgi:hypothetical protein
MDTRLLFKQKDFETDYGKRRINFSANTTGHPLKRDKKGKKKEVLIEFSGKSSNPLAKLLPHQRPAMPVQQPLPTVPTPITHSAIVTASSQIQPKPTESAK